MQTNKIKSVYVSYSSKKGLYRPFLSIDNVFDVELPGSVWVLLDQNNGNPENGHGYLWLFKTREDARNHKKNQNGGNLSATLCGPYKSSEVTISFLKKKRFSFVRIPKVNLLGLRFAVRTTRCPS